jgi:uncharacterized protein Smg (DUF494 family)
VGERVLEIVVLLISRIRDHEGQLDSFEDISSYLKSYGFTENEISSAYSWVLDQLQTDSKFLIDDPDSRNSFRILTEQERFQFSPEAIGYLLQLRHLSLLNDSHLELILERGVYMGPRPINLSQVKILIGSVLFNEPGQAESGKQQLYYLPHDDGLLN